MKVADGAGAAGAGRPRLRAAVVGAGLMGRWHAHAIARTGHVVAAVVDPDPAQAAALAARHGGARTAPDLETARAGGDFDVVHVCAPLAAHGALVREALQAGCHVVAEKPLAADAAETEALLALARQVGRLLVPVHQCLFQRGVLDAQRLLPAIGPLLHLDTVACTAGAAGRSVAAHDRVALEVLPHPLSLIARLVALELTAAGWHTRRPAPGELRADGVLAGTTLSLLVSTRGRPTTHSARLIGARGTVHIDLFHGFASVTRGRTTRLGKIGQPFVASGVIMAHAATNLARRLVAREPAYPGLRTLVRRFYAAAAAGRAAPISPEETLAVARALDLIAAGATATTALPEGGR